MKATRTALDGSTAIVVLGAPRSGTSALTGALNILGVSVGEQLLGASDANPRGYWEHRHIMTIHDRLLRRLDRSWSDARPLPDRWLETRAAAQAARRIGDILRSDFAGKEVWAIKDPRLCRLLPLWRTILRDTGVAARYILVVRDPAEVIASQRRGFPFSQRYAELLWLRYILEAEAETRVGPRAIVHYRDLLAVASERMRMFRRVAGDLAIEWPVSFDRAEGLLAEFLSSELRHERVGIADHGQPGWAAEIATAFAAGDGPALHQACDSIADRLREIHIDHVEKQPLRRRRWIARRRDDIHTAATAVADGFFEAKKTLLQRSDGRICKLKK